MVANSDTKIYVLCPSGRRNETADYCHQLCSQIVRLGLEAYMIYLPGGGENISVDDYYLRYNLPYDTGVEDEPQNIIIVPEVAATYLYFTKNTRRILWWVDVDNFFRDMGLRIVRQFDNILNEPVPKFFTFSRFDGEVEHWAHSEYARQFLKINGVPADKIRTVGDKISAVNIDLAAKKNIVAYNPVKSRDFTDVVKNLANDVEWRAVDNSEDGAEILAGAKVYVDFGDHGSRDRLTRTAAISGCVVITGRRGAAGNDVDFNIPADFKFDETVDDALAAAEKIGDAIVNFDTEYDRQAGFRAKVLRDGENFIDEVAEALGVDVPDKNIVGIVHGLEGISADIAEILFAQDVGLEPAFIIDDAAEVSHLDLKSGRRLKIISSADAKFLYGEGRINKFLRISNAAAEIEFVREKIAPADGDVIGLDFEAEG